MKTGANRLVPVFPTFTKTGYPKYPATDGDVIIFCMKLFISSEYATLFLGKSLSSLYEVSNLLSAKT